MGLMTIDAIVNEGMKQAGRDGITTRMYEMLNEWLFSQYTSFPWPYLHARFSMTLPAGTTPLNVSSVQTGFRIQRIFDPIYLRTPTYQKQRTCRIRQLLDGPVWADENTANPQQSMGTPEWFKLRAHPAGWGAWQLLPFPFPNQDFTIAFDYLYVPNVLTLANQIPLYPSDRSMVQAVKVAAQAYANRKDGADIDLLRNLVVEDRERFGSVPGTNDTQQLDGGVFL